MKDKMMNKKNVSGWLSTVLISLIPVSISIAPLIFSQSVRATTPRYLPTVEATQNPNSLNNIDYFWVGSADFYHVRYRVSGGEKQVRIRPESTNGTYFTLKNVKPSTTYIISVQACNSNFLASSDCGAWQQVSFTTAAAPKPYGVDTCKQGYVWREAQPDDRVCVTPSVRTQARNENNLAAQHREPNGGAYGPNTCKQGYVWREATANDPVCVTPQVRAQAAEDNKRAGERRVP